MKPRHHNFVTLVVAPSIRTGNMQWLSSRGLRGNDQDDWITFGALDAPETLPAGGMYGDRRGHQFGWPEVVLRDGVEPKGD